MKRFLSKRWFRILICLFALSVPLVLVATGGYWYYHVHLSRDAQIRLAMSKECHPIWKDLAEGRVVAGQPVEDLIVSTPPSWVDRHGPYVTLTYYQGELEKGVLHFTGLTVVAKDNRLVQADAWSCTWTHSFFDQWSDDERGAYLRANQAFLDEMIKLPPEQRKVDRR